jgi:hypothetical protein
MTDQNAIDAAAQRLNDALDALEAAVERRLEAGHSRAFLSEQVHALDADRARLAAELDNQMARAQRLETANREIARRLDAAMDNIRLVLEPQER